TKVIIDYFMTRKPSISRRNRIHWHYVRDDALFSTIKVVSRHQATQQYGEGTGSKPGVPDVPFDDSEEELSWKSSDDEEVGSHEEGKESDDDSDVGSDKDSDETVKSGAGKDGDYNDDEDDDDNDEEEKFAKDDEEDKETGKGGDEVRESEGESEEEEETSDQEEGSFDRIPRTPKDSEK
nr:hypothetical protein [Tanacetum cinerariifolium]